MSFSSCPPGLLFLAQTLPKLAFPLLPVLVAQRILNYDLPSYVWTLAYVFSVPVSLVVKGVSQHLREEMEIKKLGARRVPQVQCRLPGGIDFVQATVKSMNEGYPGDILVDVLKNLGGTFTFRIFWEDAVMTTEPDNLKAILATDFENFEKGWKFRWYVDSVLGSGVFNSDGDMWKFHRAMTRPFFARNRVTDFELFDRHAQVVVGRLKERFAQGEPIDFQDIVGRFTLDSATEFLFGSCVHSLSAHLPYAHNSSRRDTEAQFKPHPSDEFVVTFNQAQQQISLRTRLADMWPLAEFWRDKTKKPMKVINGYIDPILSEALAKKGAVGKKSPESVEGSEVTLLDHLVEETADPVILRDEILNIMIAGRDTTMATLTFVVYCLADDPAILAKLRQEILTQVGRDRRPTFDDVKECKYLRAVINETLRLYPPVPFNVRHCKHSTTWPAQDGGKPYYIPAGIDMPYSVWMMHRRTDLWGPDAHKFDPDRFLDERLHKYLTPNPFIFLPFNAGPRICLGQQFAYNEVSFMLVRLLQAFDSITLAPEAQPLDSHAPASWKSAPGRQAAEKLRPKAHLTLYLHKGLWLRMGEAQYEDTA